MLRAAFALAAVAIAGCGEPDCPEGTDFDGVRCRTIDAGPDAAWRTDAGPRDARAVDAHGDAASADARSPADASTTDAPTCGCAAPLICQGDICVDPVIRVAAGASHSCALRATGAVLCWGRNRDGQLGDGTTADSPTPAAVAGLDEVAGIDAAQNYTCARLESGAVSCWGANSMGQLGDGTLAERHVPGPVSALTDASSIALGSSHACAVRRGGSVVCWGWNDFGQLGTGNLTRRATPAAVIDVTGALTLSGGSAHSCAATTDGSLWCWGNNEDGQMGEPSVVTGTATPRLLSGFVGVDGVAAGLGFSCALRDSGRPTCWGSNSSGQLGVTDPPPGSTDDLRTPPGEDVEGVASVSSLAAGSDFACALRTDATVACWGNNADGQLGDGTASSRHTAAPVDGVTTARAIAAGTAHACAALMDGSVWCWGRNTDGQLGNGRTGETRASPVRVAGLP